MEGWAKVRVGGTTEWQRVWFVVTALGGGSIDAGRPSSSPSSGTGSIRRTRMSIFGKGASHHVPAQPALPCITLYCGEKAKDRKHPKYTLTNVTQAFAVYPERPEIIQNSTLFKIEGRIQQEEIRPNERQRRPTQDSFLLVMPEAESSRPGSTEMLKWLVGQYYVVFLMVSCELTPPDSHPRRVWIIWST
jgi:CCR4-NOT transcriptional complex subunit CAF120